MTATIAEENRIEQESLVATSAKIAMDQLSFVDEATQTENIFEEDECEMFLIFGRKYLSCISILCCLAFDLGIPYIWFKRMMFIYQLL